MERRRYTTNEKEKIIGGIFTITQFGWIVGGIVIFAILVLSLFRFIGFFSIILGLFFVVVGFILATKKINEIPLPKYLRLRRKYKNKTKKYINKGVHSSLEFSE